jgi:solute carrier family 25 S-adenosylmethionine transporter 26
MLKIPFACIQFPLYEQLKLYAAKHTHLEKLSLAQTALCAAMAGGTAAAATTPLDVAKTRIMLSRKGVDMDYTGISRTLLQIYQQEGIKAFFRGIVPRITWLSIGGALFLGTYEATLRIT